MTAKSAANLTTEATTNLNDNTTGDISASDVRTMTIDLIDSTWNNVDTPTIVTAAAGADTQVQFNNGGTAFGGSTGLTYDKTNKALTVGGATVTTSNPVFSATQTWNAGAVAFTGWKLNVTDTASAAASLLADLQVGSATKFSVQKDCRITNYGNGTGNIDLQIWYYDSGTIGQALVDSFGTFCLSGDIKCGTQGSSAQLHAAAGFWLQNTGLFIVKSSGLYTWTSGASAGGTVDTGIGRNAAGIVEVNNGSAGTYRDILARALRSNAVAFANVPASPVEGMIVAITDSNTNVWGASIAGSGTNHVLGYYNGTAWTVMAK